MVMLPTMMTTIFLIVFLLKIMTFFDITTDTETITD